MGVLEIVFGILVIVMAVFLIIAVLLQSGKDTQLSGTITGSADTFFGQSKANTWDRVLSKVTIAVSAVFAIVVILMYALVG
jgi:preprotein translocase subunit SecG